MKQIVTIEDLIRELKKYPLHLEVLVDVRACSDTFGDEPIDEIVYIEKQGKVFLNL